MKTALTWMSGFSKMEAMIGIESSSLSLRFGFKNKPLGFVLLIELQFRVFDSEVRLLCLLCICVIRIID
jgi:hypothetical protein